MKTIEIIKVSCQDILLVATCEQLWKYLSTYCLNDILVGFSPASKVIENVTVFWIDIGIGRKIENRRKTAWLACRRIKQNWNLAQGEGLVCLMAYQPL